MPEALQSEGLKASAEIAKQVITLSTGAVAFTVTFIEKFTAHPEHAAQHIPISLVIAWALFGLAILFSLWTLMAVTGTLLAIDHVANGWGMSEAQQRAAEGAGGNAQRPAVLMLAAFMLAIGAMVWTGIRIT